MEVDGYGWRTYTGKVQVSMVDLLEGRINISTAFSQVDDAFGEFSGGMDMPELEYFKEINQDIQNIISEIDGENDGYQETVQILAAEPTPSQFREFLDRPD